MKLINCLNFSKVISVTVLSRGNLFHNFITDGKWSVSGSLLLIEVLYSICNSLNLLCEQGLVYCYKLSRDQNTLIEWSPLYNNQEDIQWIINYTGIKLLKLLISGSLILKIFQQSKGPV